MQRTNPLIRLAKDSDLERINEIYNQAILVNATAHTVPLMPEQREEWFLAHDPHQYPVFVSLADETITGWASVSAYRPGRQALRFTAEISFYIHENFRGQGIGSALLEFALRKAPELGLRQIFAIVLEHNTASIALLTKFGFQKWGFLPEVADFEGKICGQYYYGLKIR
jgi:L-amino acid N-acyltransferase YncA